MRRTALLLTLIAAMATACGGSDDASDVVQDIETVIDEDAAEEAVEEADASGQIDAEACQQAAEALTAVPQSLATAVTGDVDVAEVQAQADLLAGLDVPEQYAADFEIVADTFAEVSATLDDVELEPGTPPDAQTQAALTELSGSLTDSEFTTASANVGEYFAAGCQ